MPPTYDLVDREKYKKVLPHTEVADIETVLRYLQADKRLKKVPITLLAWSEGTILAGMLADNKKNNIRALFLAGYAHENLSDIIKWQFSGESSMININKYFDTNHDGVVSRTEYEADSRGLPPCVRMD